MIHNFLLIVIVYVVTRSSATGLFRVFIVAPFASRLGSDILGCEATQHKNESLYQPDLIMVESEYSNDNDEYRSSKVELLIPVEGGL